MKRFLVKIVIITAIFIAGNLLFLYLLGILNVEFKKTKEISQFRNQSFQCIITGNSLSLDGFDAEYMTNNGIPSYNFALGGASLLTNIIQLEHYLENNKAPELIILGLGSHFLDRNLDVERINPAVEHFYMDTKLELETLPVIKFKWLGTDMLKLLFSSSHRKAHTKLGQYRSTRSVPDKTEYIESAKPFDVNALVASTDFKRLVELIKKHNCKLAVFQMPLYRASRNNHAEMINVKMENGFSFPVINMNRHDICEELFDPKKDWLGNSHLNTKGAAKFTKYIHKRYLVPIINK
jgi:hypothetical protein